jgi:predicted deacylase
VRRAAFEIGETAVPPGGRATLELSVGGLYTHTPLGMPVQVVHGRRDGPVVFVCAAVHGDEIIGVEVIRRLLRLGALGRLRGTLIAIPIVNVFGFHNRSRYLPDRRDLNRSLPGSKRGSIAARLGHLFFDEIVRHCDLGVDIHSAAVHRDNLPQIRADLEDPILRPLAAAFGAPVVLHSEPVEGTLRKAAVDLGIPVLVYEAGEALRFDELAIRVGMRGVLNLLRRLGMLPASKQKVTRPPAVLRSSVWVRAEQSGILRTLCPLGGAVTKGAVLGLISDPLGERETPITAPVDGVLIGRANLPLVYAGEALFHLGRTRNADEVGRHMEALQAEVDGESPDLRHDPPIV